MADSSVVWQLLKDWRQSDAHDCRRQSSPINHRRLRDSVAATESCHERLATLPGPPRRYDLLSRALIRLLHSKETAAPSQGANHQRPEFRRSKSGAQGLQMDWSAQRSWTANPSPT